MEQKLTVTVNNIFGESISREDVLNEINSHLDTFNLFRSFVETDRERILLFLEGKRSLQILEDRFFQYVLRPDIAPERIESLLSAILGQRVSVVSPLPRDGSLITDEGSQVVMDIIVKLEDGSIANVEMQRIGYRFPGERTNCYLADMTMRQYNKVRSMRGQGFSYKDMKPIRLIVIMDISSAEFRSVSPQYIHTRTTSYSSGARVTDLEEVTYISLDTYRESSQNEINTTLDAWLTFFSYEDTEHVCRLIEKYPEFLPLYRDIAEFRKNPAEVIGMFSEALRIMDRNTTKYMFEELKDTVADQAKALADKDNTIDAQAQTIDAQAQTIDDQAQTIDKYREALIANGIEIPE